MLKEASMSWQSTEKVSSANDAILQPDKDDSRAGEEALLWQNSKRKCFQAKEVIYRESTGIDRICIIRSGLVKLLSYLPNGRARIIRLHARNQWLGLEGLLGQPYEHTAIAVDDVVVEYLSTHSVQHLVMDEPGRLLQLLHQWQRYLAQADKWISEFSTGGIRPRVARLLQFLAELEYGSSTDTVELLTVSEMSEILGVTPESVSRIVATFKRRDILKKQPEADSLREIYRLDTPRLQQEAQG
jgi:CRP/FNR family transcriptional regulator